MTQRLVEQACRLAREQRQQAGPELAQLGIAERARVLGHERVEQALLAPGIDHRVALGALVGVQLAHEPEPLVEQRDELAIDGRDALSCRLHRGIAALVAHGAGG